MGGDDFCLKWNDHHVTFFSSAEQLCRGETLTDVILSCGGREFSAHRLVLSVCSSYFHGLFSQRRSHLAGESIVYLKDVDPRHMELLLSYMYRGEINVQESDLYSLLTTAKGLQIRGLTDAVAPATAFNITGAQFAAAPQPQQQQQVLGKAIPVPANNAVGQPITSHHQHENLLGPTNLMGTAGQVVGAGHGKRGAAGAGVTQVVGHHLPTSNLAVLPTVPAPPASLVEASLPHGKRIKTEVRSVPSSHATILTQSITEPTSFLVQTNHQTAPADLTASSSGASAQQAHQAGFQHQEQPQFQGGNDNFLETSDAFASLHDSAGSSGILYDEPPGSMSSPPTAKRSGGLPSVSTAATANIPTVLSSTGHRERPSLPTVPLSTQALAATTSTASTVVVVGGGEPSGSGVATTQATGSTTTNSSGSDVHTCNFCMRQFKYHMRLIEHLRTHTKERPFECKFCGKHFTQKGSCSRHERTCPKEKQNSAQVSQPQMIVP